jgi:hypothetical protein
MNSRTVASTIATQIHLRTFNLVGICLIGLWALSPIGSQAALQFVTTPFSPVPSTVDVSYFNSRQQSYAAPDGPFKQSWYTGFTMLFGASLIAPTAVKTSSVDLWGNVRIPYYSSTLNSSKEVDSDGWVHIPADFKPTYSSLFGLPVSSVQIGNTTFTVESSYIQLNCNQMTHQNSNISGIVLLNQAINSSTVVKSTLISTSGPFLSSKNVSFFDDWGIGYQGPNTASFDATLYSTREVVPFLYPQSCPDCLTMNVSTADPGTFLYQEFDGNDNSTSIFCTPQEVYVESAITCERTTTTSQNCHVTAQRLSQLPHMSTNITSLSFQTVVLGITSLLPNATRLSGNSDPVQSYIYDPTSAVGIVSGDSSVTFDGLSTDEASNGGPGNSPNPGDGDSPLASGLVSLQEFGDRMGQIVNSFLFASLWNATTFISGEPLSNIVKTQLGGNAASFIPATSSDLAAMIQNQTSAFTVSATLTEQVRIFKVSYPWIAVFIICSLAMMSSAITGVVFSRNTVLPDYLGYVSSLARESPYVRMPNGGANLDGMERARLMKNLWVRLGNVDEGRSDVGRLAFARMEDTGVVRKNNLYV